MNQNNSLYRKVAYLAGIVALMLPLFWLGQPATRGGGAESQGGKLEQLRREYGLGQAEIGDIDPASEAIRLATLGARGIATTMLWSKVNNDKMTEDWTAMGATLEQLAKLQPYFIKVWTYQAWNLTYNVSVELDDVKDRFFYVKRGIKYLLEGIVYNRDNPALLKDLGWFNGNKVGRADEHEIYRKLFKADDELHAPDVRSELRDNWLVSKDWYNQAVSAIDDKKKSLGQMNPTTFFSNPGKSQINYAEAIEQEGAFGERARLAWASGGRMWREYGNREMVSSIGVPIRLEDEEKWQAEERRLSDDLDALSPGLREQMVEEAKESLTPEEKRAKEKTEELDAKDYELISSADEKLVIMTEKLAARIARDQPELAAKVRRIASELEDVRKRIRMIDSNSGVANYKYWRARCDLEQTPEALAAHQKCYEGKVAGILGPEPEKARALYEEAFDLWAKALAQFPELGPDSATGGDVMVYIEEYGKVLERLDMSLEDPELGDKFPLWDVIAQNDNDRSFAAAMAARNERVNKAPQDREAKSLINPAEAFTDVPSTPAESVPTESSPADETSAEDEPPADVPAETSPSE